MIRILTLSINTLIILAFPSNELMAKQPNIVVIMADDMGYSDLGSWGSEIETPNLDQLAQSGLRYTQFKNTGRCCPSRASLLTGRHQHSVEMGWMTAVDEHRDGYRGQLSKSYPTIAETLQTNGYKTYMAGKWHLTVDGNYSNKNGTAKSNGSWPTDRGFEKFFGKLTGGASYQPGNDILNGESFIPKEELSDDWYYTDAISQAAKGYVEEHDFSKSPMFLYAAHYAPHRPLQAPENRIERCKKRYQAGYDVLRQNRFKRMQEIGIIPQNKTLPKHPQAYDGGRPMWEDLSKEQKTEWILEMATYAAMIEIMDDGIGLLIDTLQEKGQLENTLIFYLSDNGATREGGFISQLAADLSNTPYRSYKKWTLNGGISSPLIVHWPAKLANYTGELRNAQSHITDLVPTILDAIGITQVDSFNGSPIPTPHGHSLVPTFWNDEIEKRTFFFEHQTSRAIIKDEWKLVSRHIAEPWELYNLSNDPFEQIDLASSNPQKVSQLKESWDLWAEQHNVKPFEVRTWSNRIHHYKEKYPNQEGYDQ
ncbi:arylsulfatase [Puniceicoccaceae bacterium K14]|nr:arylsulfatase [Puniceicoccaceae bacterium K14]